MARGNQGHAICRDDADRKRFLETLAEACEKTGWQVYAYVLIGNHYHLLVETPEGNLVAGMKWTRVTQAVSRMNRQPSRRLRWLREKLLALESQTEGCK